MLLILAGAAAKANPLEINGWESREASDLSGDPGGRKPIRDRMRGLAGGEFLVSIKDPLLGVLGEFALGEVTRDWEKSIDLRLRPKTRWANTANTNMMGKILTWIASPRHTPANRSHCLKRAYKNPKIRVTKIDSEFPRALTVEVSGLKNHSRATRRMARVLSAIFTRRTR